MGTLYEAPMCVEKYNFSVQHFDQRLIKIFQLYLERIVPFTYKHYKIWPILGDHKYFLLSISSEYDKSAALTSLYNAFMVKKAYSHWG